MKPVRLRFYIAEYDGRFSSILDKAQTSDYTEENGAGFEIIKLLPKRISLYFIERKIVQETIQFPDGTEEKSNRTTYIKFKFDIIKLAKSECIIQITNAPSSLRIFTKNLQKIFSNMSMDRVIYNINDFYNHIINSPNVSRYVVTKVSAGSIPFGENTIARIDLTSKGNALKELKSKYKKKQYHLEKISIRARIQSEEYSIDITSSGSITCDPNIAFIAEGYILEIHS